MGVKASFKVGLTWGMTHNVNPLTRLTAGKWQMQYSSEERLRILETKKPIEVLI
jgi:hypothetical protein